MHDVADINVLVQQVNALNSNYSSLIETGIPPTVVLMALLEKSDQIQSWAQQVLDELPALELLLNKPYSLRTLINLIAMENINDKQTLERARTYKAMLEDPEGTKKKLALLREQAERILGIKS